MAKRRMKKLFGRCSLLTEQWLSHFRMDIMVLHHHNKNKCKVLAQIAIRFGEHNLGMRWLMADIANTTFNEPKYMHFSPKLNMVLFSLLLCYPFIFVMFFFICVVSLYRRYTPRSLVHCLVYELYL